MAPVGVIFFLHHLGLPCSKACFSGFERACGSKEETRIAEPKHLPPCLSFPAPPFPFLIQILFPLRFNPPLRARRPQARYPFAFPGPGLIVLPGPTAQVHAVCLFLLPACVFHRRIFISHCTIACLVVHCLRPVWPPHALLVGNLLMAVAV